MMMTLNLSRSTRGNHAVDETSSDTGYPQSTLLRMMLNASRQMAHRRCSRLDPDTMPEWKKRDLGFVDWGSPCHEG
ncbi:hypothetical protein AS026_23320 [Rhizobium altiplani]|uniref:Uncharacterized protein n=1 Tax=Rhizobium altiplani TaxID=1864509 RepID=A0A109J2W8_9HYPH|nr:hypothetical protein [Rhizobium altiplani]KWV41328.1 hypothetical protein AS026_23320 [Rhizobium altiplani]